jgi:hypothetical protein
LGGVKIDPALRFKLLFLYLGAGTVIGKEENQSVIVGAHIAKLFEKAAEFSIKAINHCSMYSHFHSLEVLLFSC